jgi:flagellar biosynthetic protein FlhB
MAENENGTEKTEEPTEKRLRESREKGDYPRSQELNTAAGFLASTAALMVFGAVMAIGAVGWMRRALAGIGQAGGMGMDLLPYVGLQLLELLWVVLPMLVVGVLAGLVAPAVMGSLGLNLQALAPSFAKLNPAAGLKRIWGPQGLGELVKSILRVLIVGGAATVYFQTHVDELMALVHQPLEQAVVLGLRMAMGTMLAMGTGLVLLAAADVPWQRWTWRRRLMMTRQELLDEYKETEGKPEVKGAIRRAQMALSQRRMMEAVPTADVIVVNPTHYAVALKYDGKAGKAPVVVAKGVDEIALVIRQLADTAKVPIVAAPPLARALYREVELGREIPVKLYAAVAQVLSYVFQLRTWRPGRDPMPQLPALDVPGAPEA